MRIARAGVIPALVVAMLFAACAGTGPVANDAEDPGVGSNPVNSTRQPSQTATACTLAPRSDQTVAQRGVALRDIGLFRGQAALTDADLGAYVQEELDAEWGEIPEDDPYIEVLVAALDRDRVWWRDLEADAFEGNDVYVEVLQEWAQISGGSFKPESIEETWESEDGPVTVRFLDGGKPVELHPSYDDGWIDPGIVIPINELLADSGLRFEFLQAFDQTAFVMALEDREREALLARGWCFE
jgi:hypothetical protein